MTQMPAVTVANVLPITVQTLGVMLLNTMGPAWPPMLVTVAAIGNKPPIGNKVTGPGFAPKVIV